MNKILRSLKSPWFIGISGLLAVGALIWYLGPLIAIAGNTPLATDAGRVWTLMTVGGMYGLYQLIYYIDALKRNRAILTDLAGQATGGAVGGGDSGGGGSGGDGGGSPDAATQQRKKKEEEAASSAEISTLKQGLEEALATLKRARLGGKSGRFQYLYQLPWYIIIGPPGSG
ncbi:MAG: hypothetical protein IT490_01415, partial [Candidatus Contendobacter sp.]|nr:hypothetical protein [Candidatus Contendobacter sp.]